jgi:DNA-directed RNA polymerase subunit D
MVSDVPKLAIDYIEMYDNTSVLFDEMLALRMGLIPIKTNLDMYHLKSECDCKGEGCALCEVKFTLSAEGPCMVHSSDMQSTDPETVPADATVPIVELKAGQKIVLQGTARLGYGKEHSKFQPVCAAGYKNIPVITVSEKCDLCKACVDECPKGILSVEKNKLAVSDPYKCSLCRLCMEACDTHAIDVGIDKRSFIFSIETDGSFTAREIILRAVKSIKSRSDSLGEVLETF